MKKRLLEYVSVFGILLCVGLLLYNMTELKKLSMQYERLQENVQQMLTGKEADTQVNSSNEPETSGGGFLGDSFLEKGSAPGMEWSTEISEQESEQSTENIKHNYNLNKNEYLYSDK